MKIKNNKKVFSMFLLPLFVMLILTPSASASDPVDSCGYPYSSGTARTSVVFNKNEILRAFSQTADSTPNDLLNLWYNSEHALTLGVRQIVVKTSSGTATTDYPVSVLVKNPDNAPWPETGSNILFGDQAGTDAFGRPIWPTLFITDITSDPSDRSGDWQFGGTASKPQDVFGSWKSVVKTVDNTVSPAEINFVMDPDPAPNHWDLLPNNPAPSGLKDEGYGSKIRWSMEVLNLTPGHNYRLQFMAHDGDQNKQGGNVGEICANISVQSVPPSPAPPAPPPSPPAPAIRLFKSANPSSFAFGGGVTTYTYQTANPGPVVLTNVQTVDAGCSPLSNPISNTNSDAVLDVGETWTYTCQTRVDATVSTAATATGQANSMTARDTAVATVTVGAPSLPTTGTTYVPPATYTPFPTTGIVGFPESGIGPENQAIPWEAVIPSSILSLCAVIALAKRKNMAHGDDSTN